MPGRGSYAAHVPTWGHRAERQHPLKPDRLRRWVSASGHDKPRLDEIKRAAAADVAVIREDDGSVSPNATGLQNDDL
jgi:hypothetical protein